MTDEVRLAKAMTYRFSTENGFATTVNIVEPLETYEIELLLEWFDLIKRPLQRELEARTSEKENG